MFELGQVVATPGVLQMVSQGEIQGMLYRHCHGDWGMVCSEDAEENWLALEHGFEIMSVYVSSNGIRVWVITEADRSCTTVLLPEEY